MHACRSHSYNELYIEVGVKMVGIYILTFIFNLSQFVFTRTFDVSIVFFYFW
jgi:hypothetical protein